MPTSQDSKGPCTSRVGRRRGPSGKMPARGLNPHMGSRWGELSFKRRGGGRAWSQRALALPVAIGTARQSAPKDAFFGANKLAGPRKDDVSLAANFILDGFPENMVGTVNPMNPQRRQTEFSIRHVF